MRKQYFKKLIALASVASLSLSGCTSFINDDVASYPLASPLTQSELVDYYAKALQYDSIVSRNVTVHETTYEVKDIEGAKAEKLKGLASQCESILGEDSYEPTEETLKLVSKDTFGYIKGVLDNEAISNGVIKNITGALGYYFVDIEYDIAAKNNGTFTKTANILGLNGAFFQNYKGEYLVDSEYMTVVVNKLNEYFSENVINKCAVFNSADNSLDILDDTPPVVDGKAVTTNSTSKDKNTKTNGDTTLNAPGDENETDEDTSDIGTDVSNTDNVDTDTNTVEETDSTSNKDKATYIPDDYNSNYTIVTPEERKVKLDIALINKVVGSSLRQSAVFPDLELIYNKPSKEGTISGYGITCAGGNGLKTFGFDRNKLSGKVTLRYVFKDDPTGSGDILGVNTYLTSEEITNGTNVSDSNVLIPEFLQNEFDKIIDRADRVQVDYNLSGMMSGNIYEDIGEGVLRGFKQDNTNINKCMSTIRQVISRDTENNSYLLEVETTTIEGAKDIDSYGTYKDKSYVVVQQQDTEFIITDWLRVSRTLVNEPAINPESNTQKRLIALNLSGTISDDSKDDIKKLLSDLYTAGSNRILRGPKDVVSGGETVTIQRGMYDCFSSDTSILSTDDLEYENSSLRDILVKHGVDKQSIYSGTVTEWIGGYEDQAEFTTEELVSYQGSDDGYYMQVYYLVSMENDKWVIAERTVLDEYEVKDQELMTSIKERVGQK